MGEPSARDRKAVSELLAAGLRSAESGKYLTFKIMGEEYGIEILRVREIIGLMDVTSVPRTPSFVKGVINLRGKVIPVIDLRVKFLMEPGETTEESCIIVVEVATTEQEENTLMGILVDSVSDVLDVLDSQIEPPPDFGENVDMGYILGMGKIEKKVVMLLNIDKVLTINEVETMLATKSKVEASADKESEKEEAESTEEVESEKEAVEETV